MTIRQTVLTLAIPMALLATSALAQSDADAILEALDLDGSGSLSQSEASVNESLMARWSDLDTDANGELSAEELAALAE